MAQLSLILLALFCLKLLWNVLTPYVVERGLFRSSGSVSMMPIVEVGLWVLMILISVFSHEDWWLFHTASVFLYGAGAIIASYVLAIMVGRLVLRRKRGDEAG